MTRPPIRVLTTFGGLVILPDLSDADASAVGQHWNAVRAYLEDGDDTKLAALHGVTVAGWELETDLDTIEWHAVRGDVSFESIYDGVI